MQEVRTFCRVCEPSCGLIAEVEAGEITRLKPDKAHPVTRGFACHKGIATLEIHKDEDRLNYPLRRNDHGELKRISWNEAGQGIAAAIKALKEKYGEDVIIKKFEKSKSWLSKKLSGTSENQIDNLLNILEEKFLRILLLSRNEPIAGPARELNARGLPV